MMKILKHRKGIMIIVIALALFNILSCTRNEGPAVVCELPDETKVVNQFIFDYTSDWYLWRDYITPGIDLCGYENPTDLFEYMAYRDLDYWSFVTDDYQGLLNSLNGTQKAAGYIFQGFYYPNSNANVYIVVEYVYGNSQAQSVGLQRGDVIISVDGTLLTESNFLDLLRQDAMTLGMGAIVDDNVVDLGASVDITRVEQTFNPILMQEVIETGGKRIGYLLYDQFIENFESELTDVISNFNAQGIDELVLDLRYNPGGYATTSAKLASMLVASENVGDVFISKQWNSLVTDYFQDDPEADEIFHQYFTVQTVHLGLDRLFVLSSGKTASASEAIINGLQPYMNVVVIGEQTSGKYTGAILFEDELEPIAVNWGLYLVVNKIANADGVTDFINGLSPDYEVSDDYATPLGEETEPLLAKAIEIATGVTAKSAPESRFKNFRSLGTMYENEFIQNGVMIFKHPALPKK